MDSNSHGASFPRRRASWAFASLPSKDEGRRSAERRALVVQKRLSDAPSRDLWLRDRASGDLAALRHDGFPPLPVPVQPTSVAEPLNGPGRQPLSLRVCACEAQPRTPHPTGLGYPAPTKLSLCPTSERLLKRP